MGSSMRPFITLVVVEDRWHGRWSGASSWLLEAREVEPDKDNWHTKEGHGPIDGRDSGYITARSFEFTKKEPSSRMLLTYNDNLRALGANKACRWEIRVDDKSCPSGKIVGDLYVVNDNPHRQHNLVGFCDQLAKGKHTMKVWVSQLHAGSDCYTGCVIAFCFWGWIWCYSADGLHAAHVCFGALQMERQPEGQGRKLGARCTRDSDGLAGAWYHKAWLA